MSKEYVKKHFKDHYAACKSILDGLIKQWGYVGWHGLGDALQQALIAERVLHVFASRGDDSKITAKQINEYLQAIDPPAVNEERILDCFAKLARSLTISELNELECMLHYLRKYWEEIGA